jgi:glutamyl-tRNA synthetase
VIDSLEGITHALRSTEDTDRNVLYQWLLKKLNLHMAYMHDFSRPSFVRTFLSKRQLGKLVDTGVVTGWDDPRMPTVRGVRRRGMNVFALKDFIIKQGPSRNITAMEWSAI